MCRCNSNRICSNKVDSAPKSLPQLCLWSSSLMSPQSLSPSQTHVAGIQRASSHLNWSLEHVLTWETAIIGNNRWLLIEKTCRRFIDFILIERYSQHKTFIVQCKTAKVISDPLQVRGHTLFYLQCEHKICANVSLFCSLYVQSKGKSSSARKNIYMSFWGFLQLSIRRDVFSRVCLGQGYRYNLYKHFSHSVSVNTLHYLSCMDSELQYALY